MSKNIWRRWWVKLWIEDIFKPGGILDKLPIDAVGTFFLLFAWSGDTRIMKVPGIISFDGIGLSDEQYCHKLRMTPEKFKEMVKILTENEMIIYDKGIINIVNFDYWQNKKEGEVKPEVKFEPKNETKNEVQIVRSKKLEVRSKKRHSSADADPRPSQIVENWNKIPGVRKCKLTDNLRDKIKTRLKNPDFSDNNNWLEGLRRAFKSSFIRGMTKRTEEHKHWKASIYFFLRPSKFDMLMQGEYDDKPEGREAD